MPGLVRRRIASSILLLLSCLAPGTSRAADLLEMYARARESDPTFQSSRFDRQIADQALKESQAGALPVLTANASGSKVYQDIRRSDNILFSEGQSDFFNTDVSISLTQPIYRAEVLNRIPQARAEVRLAESRFVAAEHDLLYRLTQAYFSVLAADDELQFTIAERMAINRQLEETEQRLGSGLARATDLHDARARFALAQASEIEAGDALDEARRALAEITGVLLFDLETLGETYPLVPPQWPEVETWVEAALFQNPSIKAREAAVETAEREIRLQRGARLPTVDFVASYRGSDSGGTVFGGGNEILTTDVAVRIGIPILDSGRVSALTQSAFLRQKIAMQELELEKRRIERETRAAFQGVRSGITRIEALAQSVFSQRAALAAKEEGLRSGLETGVAVLDARRDLYLAERDLAEANYLYILNHLRLKRAAGSLSVDDLRKINDYLQ